MLTFQVKAPNQVLVIGHLKHHLIAHAESLKGVWRATLNQGCLYHV